VSDRAPIVGAPSLSVGRDGNLVLNFGTGDVNYIGTATNQNYVFSVSEVPPSKENVTSTSNLLANVNWYFALPTAGEMISGPSQVFDSAYYFATFRPSTTSGCNAGNAYIWGMDYMSPGDASGNSQTSPTTFNSGGVYEMTPSPTTTGCSTNTAGSAECVESGSAIIPGLTITATQACATASVSTTDPVTGGPLIQTTSSSPPTYSISALEGTTNGSSASTGSSTGSGAAVAQVNIAVSVRSMTVIDSWASVVE
jgi:hypothetical protein